jgi:hypothetical protein
MLVSRRLSTLSLIGLLLILQAGCTTSSMRNLFSWNRKSEYHTLEELQKQSGRKSPEPAKTASSNPLTGGESAAGESAMPPLASSEKKQTRSGNSIADSGDQRSAADPFLKEETLTAASNPRTIQRTAAVISEPEPSETTGTVRNADVAEALIATGGKAEKQKPVAAKKPVPSSLEARKLAELDALLEGRELAGARRVGTEASVKVSQTREALKRTRETAASHARTAADVADQTKTTARKIVEDSLAFESLSGAEADTDPAEYADSSDVAEPLIQHRSGRAAITDARRKPAASSQDPLSDTEDAWPAEDAEITESTSVADAESLFGALHTSASRDSRSNAPETSHFNWKSSTASDSGSPAASPGLPLRLAGLHRETAAGDVKMSRNQIPIDSPSSPDFDEQPFSEKTHHAPTSGNTLRDAGSRAAGALTPAPAPVPSHRLKQHSLAPLTDEGAAKKSETTDSADSAGASAEVRRVALLSGLSARTWGLAAAGGIVLSLLFLPTKRRILLRPTAAGQA